jgi:hypothetical protein
MDKNLCSLCIAKVRYTITGIIKHLIKNLRLYFHQKTIGEIIMSKLAGKKRPCCICRKWFQPDIRHQNRQKTCGRPQCKKELHRRSSEKWNKRNKEYFSNNYLSKKIEQIEDSGQEKGKHKEPESSSKNTKPLMLPRSPPTLPCEIIINEFGIKNLIIIHYLANQIVRRCGNQSGFL